MRKITAVLLTLALLTAAMTVLALSAAAEAPAWVDPPAEVVEVTGGIPDTLDGIPEQYDISEAVRINDELTLSDALKNLVENGSCEIPALEDENWNPNDNMFISYEYENGFNMGFPLNISVEEGRIKISPIEPITDDIISFELVVNLPGDKSVRAELHYSGGRGSEPFIINSVTLNYTVEAGSEIYKYEQRYSASSNGQKDVYVTLLQKSSDGNTAQRWDGIYSYDTGKLDIRDYRDRR